ncbi:sensor histidine kinase [Planctomycetota bacterium]
MATIIEKRKSLHRNLKTQQLRNNKLQFQVGQMQALANIGTTTCMIAHEINNLLTPLTTYAELAINNPDDKALTDKVLRKTAKNCQRASEVMQSILTVANGKSQNKKKTPLRKLVEEIFNCLCRDFSKDAITVKIDIPDDLWVHAVPVEIQQVLMNLILNARDAMLANGGTLTIKADQTKEQIVIEVADTGCGIEPENLEKIFVPFFTTKSKEDSQVSGSGLGLAFCKKIIDEHAGSITVDSPPSRGATFKITLS